MANVIKHKRGSGSDPSASDLILGELAIRTDTGKLFTKMDSGAIAEIAGGGSDIAINTLSSSSGTGGGSATFNGSAYRFTLSAPPNVSAAQLLVSINGVIQKPVAGTGQPSEGFSVDGTDIILGDAPAAGSDFFILTFKSLGVSEPADNSVTSAKIVDGAIVNADINASASIAGTKISPNFGSQNTTTTGIAAVGELQVTSTAPKILFIDSDTDPDYELRNMNGVFRLRDSTNDIIRITQTGSITDIAGHVDVGAGIDVTGAITGTGDLTIDTNTLHVDSSNNRVGIGTTSPVTLQHNRVNTFSDDINKVALTLSNNQSSGVHQYFQNASTGTGVSNGARIGLGNTDNFLIQHFEAKDIQFSTNGQERMRISSDGKVGINIAGSDNTSPVRNLDIADSSGAILRLISSDDSLGVNERLGEIEFFTDDDDGGHIGSFIKAIADPSDSFGRRTALLFGTQSAEAQNAVEMMRLTASGRLGISTTNPQAKLGIGDTGNNGAISQLLKLGNDSSGAGTGAGIQLGAGSGNAGSSVLLSGFYDGTGTTFTVSTCNTFNGSQSEKFRITNDGKCGIGTQNPSAKLSVADDSGITIEATTNATPGKLTIIGKNNSGLVSAITRIESEPESSSNAATTTTFNNRDSSNNVNEHMRITSAGHIRSGVTSAIQAEKYSWFRQESDANTLAYFHQGASANVSGIIMRHGRGLSGFSGKMISFCRNDATEVGSVVIGNSSTAFNTSSDYRLKENVTPISDGITRLKTLKPYRFNFKDDTTKPVIDGFFAHEVTAVPEAITGTKDEVDSDNNPIYQSIDQSKLVPLLVAALQEAIGRIEVLEAK